MTQHRKRYRIYYVKKAGCESVWIVFNNYIRQVIIYKFCFRILWGALKLSDTKGGTGYKGGNPCSGASKTWTSSFARYLTPASIQKPRPSSHLKYRKEKLTPYASCCTLQTLIPECQALQGRTFLLFLPSIHTQCSRGWMPTSHRYGMTKSSLNQLQDKDHLQVSFPLQNVYETTNGSQVTFGMEHPSNSNPLTHSLSLVVYNDAIHLISSLKQRDAPGDASQGQQ